MDRTNVLVISLLMVVLLEAFLASALNTSKPSQPVTQEKATIPCPVLQEVVEKDGAYKVVYWSLCTSRNCDNQHTTWTWIAGMDGKGETQVGRNGINITSEGALEIQKVHLSDAGKYMCTVKRINYTSPRVHFATLVVIKDGRTKADSQRQTKTTNEPHAKDCKEDHSKGSENRPSASTVATCIVSALLLLAVGYIVYLKRSDLPCWSQRNSEARGSASDPDVV